MEQTKTKHATPEQITFVKALKEKLGYEDFDMSNMSKEAASNMISKLIFTRNQTFKRSLKEERPE